MAASPQEQQAPCSTRPECKGRSTLRVRCVEEEGRARCRSPSRAKKKKMAGAQAEAFLAEYAGFLRDLKRNERSAISLLSMLAADNKQLAGGIVSTLERHILTVRCV